MALWQTQSLRILKFTSHIPFHRERTGGVRQLTKLIRDSKQMWKNFKSGTGQRCVC